MDEGIKKAERLQKCLEIALDNRKFEIELIWKRTLVFWGFVAVLLVAVGQAVDKSRRLALVFESMGVVFSLVWTLVNRASKSWQESWEIKTSTFFEQIYQYDKLFRWTAKPQDEVFWLLRPRKYSVSRLLIALSDFSVVFWMALLIYHLRLEYLDGLLKQLTTLGQVEKMGAGLFALFSVVYVVIYVGRKCRSRREDALTGDVL